MEKKSWFYAWDDRGRQSGPMTRHVVAELLARNRTRRGEVTRTRRGYTIGHDFHLEQQPPCPKHCSCGQRIRTDIDITHCLACFLKTGIE